jgi:hypothetical protein
MNEKAIHSADVKPSRSRHILILPIDDARQHQLQPATG